MARTPLRSLWLPRILAPLLAAALSCAGQRAEGRLNLSFAGPRLTGLPPRRALYGQQIAGLAELRPTVLQRASRQGGTGLPSTAQPAGRPQFFASNGIANWQQGPVQTRVIGIYILWIGTFTPAQKDLTRKFILSLNPNKNPAVTVDDWWALNARYYGGRLRNGRPTGGVVSPRLVLQREFSASARAVGIRNNVLGDVAAVVAWAIPRARWPVDPNAQYIVFTDRTISQVGVPGMQGVASCTHYCGWHSYFTFRGQPLTYGWVGIPSCSVCGSAELRSNGGRYLAPSLDEGIHQALSTLAHEVAEIASDPYLTSWYDSQGLENADKCAYSFGRVQVVNRRDGRLGIRNLVGVSGSQFLIQQNWHPVTGRCSLTP